MAAKKTYDVYKLSDAEINAQYSALCRELRRRLEKTRCNCDDLNLIRGQEMAKRALLVAAAGKHSILFIGGPAVGKTMLRAAALSLGDFPTFESRPCPCGYHGSSRKPCDCTSAQIEKVWRAMPLADINIEVCEVPEREMNGRTPGTGTAELQKQISTRAIFLSTELDDECRTILKAAVAELGMNLDSRERCIRVARTIANLDHSENIRVHHLYEAINYRSLSGRMR